MKNACMIRFMLSSIFFKQSLFNYMFFKNSYEEKNNMNISTQKSIRDEKGFTLVELAIVMVIIGLLIGGILKGQEMIANAQVTSTIANIKGVDAAASTFRDIYSAMPGDMNNAVARVPGCVAPCFDGNGNASLETVPLVATPDAEAANFFRHLGGADLLTGADVTAVADTYLQMNIPGTQIVPGTQVGAALGNATAGTARSGIWLGLVASGATGNAIALSPLQAGRIDRKMDDGVAIRGGVISSGSATACSDAAGAYIENRSAIGCALAIRIQL